MPTKNQNAAPHEQSPLTQGQVSGLVKPLVDACFTPPLAQRVQDAAEQHVARLFLTGTRHVRKVIDSGFDVSTVAEDTREPYRLSDFQTTYEFLEEPYRTEPTFESGSGFSTTSLYSDFDTDIIYPTVDTLVLEALNQARANPEEHDPDLLVLASFLIPLEQQAEEMAWWKLAGDDIGDLIGEAIADSLYDDPFITWLEAFHQQPLEPIIHRNSEAIRLEQEKERALTQAHAIKAAMLAERARAWIERLGPPAKKRYELPNRDDAWAVAKHANAIGASPEETHTIIDHMDLSIGLRDELHARLRQRIESLAQQKS